MLTVDIKAGGQTLYHLTAQNVGNARDKEKGEWRWYKLKCGCKLKHDRDKGALCLFIQMVGHEMMCDKKQKDILKTSCVMCSGTTKRVKCKKCGVTPSAYMIKGNKEFHKKQKEQFEILNK